MPVTNAARDRLRQGFAFRATQRIEEAVATIDDAAALAPDDAAIALAQARIHWESWRPAAALFARVTELAPDDPNAIGGLTAALAVEGRHDAADALLQATVTRHPAWVDGHLQLAQLRHGAAADAFDRSFAAATRVVPTHLPLWLAWFRLLATARDWAGARRVLAQATAQAGRQRALDLCAIFLASESDEAATDPRLFDAAAGVDDPGLDLCRVRFWLRNARPDRAEAIALARIDGPAARTFWPYLSLAWRLMDDSRATWFDGGTAYIAATDIEMPPAERAALAATVRGLLATGRRHLEQSVRGGIQTERNLFFHHDPTIQRARGRVGTAVADYIAALPPMLPGHPLLGPARDTMLFEGSWSVLLRGDGHHAPHTHSRGWISSAFYLDLPDTAGDPDPHAGHLAFGTPPLELGLDLPPIHRVEPAPARLVLFPSTTWHATLPFATGERLTIAFDVAVPAAG
ncbi:MAG: hypothetical protein J0I47_00190 [Sphingomonas sp.]|uniref:putative 2OG-Fe(II) oxygenase n=1 Tax=Sphingomonas sp. TaxID=28214 RepID=UPI001AC7BFA3|nr:putative 2OG-Fe(II) oxygenase [Sphingomonas sp.]MBN8806647.1 hypothetical protein [Sphingomonas sp.]